MVLATLDTRREYDELFSLFVPVALVVFACVAIVLAIPLVRDRARPGRKPSGRASSPRLELGYAALLAVVAAVLVWRSLAGIGDVPAPLEGARAATGTPALTVRVLAAKWNWRFEYPGGVVQQGAGPGSVARLVVPADRPVRFRLESLDVVHAFWVPEARFKYDAYPGHANVFDMVFASGRRYEANRCSEYCGVYHAQMRFGIDVLPPPRFRAWLRARQREAAG
jgi:cytochrome c oxidase subunit 2